MKKILLASLIFTATLVASRDSNVAALKLYCASRLAQGQPVEQVFFYLKLKEAALKQLNPYKLATGITGIEKLDGLNIALRGYLVNWDANTIGLAFEHQRALLPKLAAVYRQEGAQLWDVEVTDEPTRGVAVQQIKV